LTAAAAPPIRLRFLDTHRLIPSRYPPVGLFDAVAAPADLELVFALEGWTNDRISAELGVIRRLPASEWVVGSAHASVVMAAFCHPHPGGSRFNDATIGAWYAARALATAHREIIHHRTAELAEIGIFDARVEMRQYLADFDAEFHDVRGDEPAIAPLHDPASYEASQAFGVALREAGANGIVYRSVRHAGGECLACFRPPLVANVRPAAHFEYRWAGGREPAMRELAR
jgi:RES domain-containing protein